MVIYRTVKVKLKEMGGGFFSIVLYPCYFCLIYEPILFLHIEFGAFTLWKKDKRKRRKEYSG